MLDLKYLRQHSQVPALKSAESERCLQRVNQWRDELKCPEMPIQGPLSLQSLKRSPAEINLVEYKLDLSGKSELDTQELPGLCKSNKNFQVCTTENCYIQSCAHILLQDPKSGSFNVKPPWTSAVLSLEKAQHPVDRPGASETAAVQTALHSIDMHKVLLRKA